MVKRALTRQRRKYKARRIIQEVQKGKKHQFVCRVLHCEENDMATRDRQTWKNELERYSRKKYQDDEMKTKAKRELVEWEERSKQERDGGSQGRRMTMSVLMQNKASFSNGKAVGIDGISADSEVHSGERCRKAERFLT